MILLPEWGRSKSDLEAPIPVGYLASAKSLKLGIALPLQFKLSGELIDFYFVSTKHVFINYIHEGYENKSFKL
jgi:hypothetical protein